MRGLFDDIQPEKQSNHVLKGQVEELLTKAKELISQIKEEGVKLLLLMNLRILRLLAIKIMLTLMN